MNLFELEIKNLTPASNMGVSNGALQDSYTLVKFTNVNYATAANGGATGVVTSSNSGDMSTLSPTTGLFNNTSTAPNLATVNSVDLRTWFESIPNIAKEWSGVATGTIGTQVAFCPASDGNLLMIVANNGIVVNNLPVFYNNNIGIAFDNSKISVAAFDLYPATAVTNCLGDQDVMLLGDPVLNANIFGC